MYDNIAALRFDVGANGEVVAGALVSAEGEVMDLRQAVQAEGRVEEWMTGVLLEMRRTNRLITKDAIFHYCEDRGRSGTPSLGSRPCTQGGAVGGGGGRGGGGAWVGGKWSAP